MRVPRLRDFFDLSGREEAIAEEAHTLPESAPYTVVLDQLPKVNTSATSLLSNVWDSVAMATSLITVSLETSPGTWATLTITDGTPASGEVGMMMADATNTPYAPQLVFHSSAAGLNVKISYTGMGTVPLASYLQTLFDNVSPLLAGGTSSSSGGGGLPFSLSGPLNTGEDLCEPIVPAQEVTISGGTLVLLNSGSTGTTTIDLLKCSDLAPSGVSILTAAVSIVANGGAQVVDIASSLNTSLCTVAATEWLRLEASAVATGAETLSGRLLT